MLNDADLSKVPSYQELRRRTDAPTGSSWGVFGATDELGTLNFLTPERTLAAASAIRSGQVFNLDYPLDRFAGPIRFRGLPRHSIYAIGPLGDGTWGAIDPQNPPAGHSVHILDDYVDGLYLQGSTQIDGLRHHAHPEHGLYNGFAWEEIRVGTPTLGIQHWSERGIAGRGVLIDVAEYRERTGMPLDHSQGESIDVALLQEVLKYQATTVRQGDIVLLRTDYISHHARAGDDDLLTMKCAGLAQTLAMAEWLWNNQIPMVASDNLAVESMGSNVPSEFGEGHLGRLHDQLIPLLGMALGELWQLDDLATACAADRRYDFFLTAKPLNLIGGCGTPANALAIR